MTPIKSIVVRGTVIFACDQADNLDIKAVCLTERDAEWVAEALATRHRVPLERPDLPMHSVTTI